MAALFARGTACWSSRKLFRSLISDSLVGSVVVALHDVRIPSAITAQPKVRRSEYPFIDSARFKVSLKNRDEMAISPLVSSSQNRLLCGSLRPAGVYHRCLKPKRSVGPRSGKHVVLFSPSFSQDASSLVRGSHYLERLEPPSSPRTCPS